jgi:hypothetical protein
MQLGRIARLLLLWQAMTQQNEQKLSICLRRKRFGASRLVVDDQLGARC